MDEPFARIKIQRDDITGYIKLNMSETFVVTNPKHATVFQSITTAQDYITKCKLVDAKPEPIE